MIGAALALAIALTFLIALNLDGYIGGFIVALLITAVIGCADYGAEMLLLVLKAAKGVA